MSITSGSDALASDFISASAGAGDSGKVAKLNGSGVFDNSFYDTSFGGDGSDGALTITSGTTTVDLSSARVVVKQYSSISITGTGKLAFSNPHSNGSFIFLLSKGDVTLTSSTAPMLDASALGAAGGAGGAAGTNAGTGGSSTTMVDLVGFITNAGGGASGTGSDGTGGAIGTFTTNGTALESFLLRKYNFMQCGAGGGGGATQGTSPETGGVGGRGGGCLVIECGGAWNFTTSAGISVAGQDGGETVTTTAGEIVGGGGGGGGGMFFARYKTLTANSGTVTSSGGIGGDTYWGTGFSGAIKGGGGGGGSVIAAGATAATAGTASPGAASSGKAGGNGGAGYSKIEQAYSEI